MLVFILNFRKAINMQSTSDHETYFLLNPYIPRNVMSSLNWTQRLPLILLKCCKCLRLGSTDNRMMNIKLGRIWKEAVMA